VSNPVLSALNDLKNAITQGNSEVQQVTGVKAPTPQTNVTSAVNGASQVASDASSLSSLPGEIGGIWSDLTDGQMWRSLGWLLLGVILIIIGLVLLLGEKVMNVASKLPIVPV
jgi:hypothetical protein